MDSEPYGPLRYRKRWFCYLDLLGFTSLVHDKNIERVIPLYKQALEHLKQHAKPKKRLGVIYSWFSDTFIIYSRDDSEREFSYVEQVGRLFFQKLILHKIPVRGAITHGALYSQSSENIFVGPALIDAYNYAEKQTWLGFILTPSVFKRLENTPLSLEKRPHYRPVTEPGVIFHEPSTPVYAFAFNNGSVNGKNPYLTRLEGMKMTAPSAAKAKYERTIAFAEQHQHVHRLHRHSDN
jgi:hypothetical protein